MGLVGPGFIAAHHIDAVRRLGDVEVVAIAGSSMQSATRKAQEYKVDRAYGSFEDLTEKACRRNQRQDCLPCHMRPAHPLPNLTFTDHRIRIY